MNYLQESQFRKITGPNGVGILFGALLGILGGQVHLILAVAGVVMFFFFVLREHAESKSGFRRAETHAPAMMAHIRGVTKEAFLQAPDLVRVNLERALVKNIQDLEEIALGLRSEANVLEAGNGDSTPHWFERHLWLDRPFPTSRKEQAAVKFAMIIKDIAEAHAKYSELTGRVLPSRVLKAQMPQSPAAPGDSPSV